MDMKEPPRLPLWIASRLIWPPFKGSLKSKLSSTKRCGVSSWVSMTRALRWTCSGVIFDGFGAVWAMVMRLAESRAAMRIGVFIVDGGGTIGGIVAGASLRFAHDGLVL